MMDAEVCTSLLDRKKNHIVTTSFMKLGHAMVRTAED